MITTILDRPGAHWIDCVEPTDEELKALAESHSIHSTSIQDCLQPDHLPKYEKIGQTSFIIFRAHDERSKKDCHTMRELTRKVAVFFDGDTLLTIHRKDQPYLKTLRERWSASLPSVQNPVFLIVCDLLQATLETYHEPMQAAEIKLDEFEDKIFLQSATVFRLRELYVLRRRVTVMLKMFHLAKEVLSRLTAASEGHAPILQNVREELERVQFSADQLLESVNNLLHLYLSLQSHRTNEVIRVLTVFSVFFMPLTFIVGVYGMNFDVMPELRWPFGYLAVWGFMVALTGGLYWWFRRKGFFR